MPAFVSAIRAYLMTDALDHPLGTPQLLNLETDVIPYGARVRFEADITADEPVLPPWADINLPSGGHITDADRCGLVLMYRSGGNTFSASIRLPYGWLQEIPTDMYQQSAAPRFTSDSPPNNWPSADGGQYVLRVIPTLASAPAGSDMSLSVETPFRLGPAPALGGAAPRITRFEGIHEGSDVFLGQPWLASVTVEDADRDTVAVVFSVFRGGTVFWWVRDDDGRFGDEKAGDGRYSILRVGGDLLEEGGAILNDDVPVTLSAQAVDLQGNWSEPATINYKLKFSQEPLWMQSPTPGAPNIIGASVTRGEVIPAFGCFSASCDSPDAWVCAHMIPQTSVNVIPLFDDGYGTDITARDGIHSGILWLPWEQRFDVICYAVPKSGPLVIGRKMAASCPSYE